MTPLLWSLVFLAAGAVLHYLATRPQGSPTLAIVGQAAIWAGVAGLLLVAAGPW